MAAAAPDQPPAWLAGLGARPHRYFIRLGSTNDEAAAWALAGAPAGAVVLAEEQTAGRGRQGRAWLAAPGSSLLMSVVLRPQVSAAWLPRLTLMGAVALADVLTGWGLAPRLKWPNDVLLGGRKTAGILAEAVWSGQELRAVVLGIGVNVFRHALPDDVPFPATTLEAALGRPPDRGELLVRLLERVDFWSERLADRALLDACRVYSVTLGQRVTVRAGDTVWVGLAEDLDEQGALLLRTDDGQRHRLLAGDVTLHEEQAG